MNLQAHPSFFALDLAARGATVPGVHEHVAQCSRCSAHLQRTSTPLLPPAAMLERVGQRRSGFNWIVVTGPIAAAACVVLALTMNRSPVAAVKGLPSASLFVRHEGTVNKWDGLTPVDVGDALRVEVDPGSFAYVAVVNAGRAGSPDVLFAGARPPGLVPGAWAVDETGRAESMVVLFSRRPLRTAEISQAVENVPRGADVWAVRFDIKKSERRPQ
jgi:hypothetical protein